jgi:hypothetical protein
LPAGGSALTGAADHATVALPRRTDGSAACGFAVPGRPYFWLGKSECVDNPCGDRSLAACQTTPRRDSKSSCHRTAGRLLTGSSAPKGTVDVAAIMDKLAGQSKEKLDWRHSIVDLMKLLDLDSSLAARKTLAGELHYTGSTDDSATMNVWLHKQVMAKLAENGGKVPDELKH